jgi:lipopolysaccharide export system permease protein
MGLKSVRFNKTLTKYVLSELTGPFFLGLLIFTFVLLMGKVLDLIELVIKKGVDLGTVLKLLIYIMPSFLVLTIPMAVLVATLTAFGRLSTDSEITAMKASGISLYTLFIPIVFFAVAAAFFTFFFYAKALPWGNQNFRVTLYELARTKASIGLKEHIFNNTFRGLIIYIDEISDVDNSFEGVMISDSRDQKNPQTIFARKGRLISDEEALRVILRLENGTIHPKQVSPPPKSLKYQTVAFPTLDILLSFQDENGQPGKINIPRTEREMTVTQLYEQYMVLRQQNNRSGNPNPKNTPETENSSSQEQGILQYLFIVKHFFWESFFLLDRLSSSYLVELHKRFAFPCACLVFGLIGLPLGIQSRRAGKSGGYAISVVLLLVYYIFITAGESLGDDGRLPVFLAVWTPNILLGGIGILLLIRMARR